MRRDRFKQLASAHDLLDVQNERQAKARLASLEDFVRHLLLEHPTRYTRFWMTAAWGMLVVSALMLTTLMFMASESKKHIDARNLHISILQEQLADAQTARAAPVNLNHTCVKWMFEANFKDARKQVCKK